MKMRVDWKSRMKNYGMWSSGLAFIGLVLVNVCDIDLGEYQTIVNAGLMFANALGLINNPTQGNWYGDNQEIEE